jgi:hypothetical protein
LTRCDLVDFKHVGWTFERLMAGDYIGKLILVS